MAFAVSKAVSTSTKVALRHKPAHKGLSYSATND